MEFQIIQAKKSKQGKTVRSRTVSSGDIKAAYVDSDEGEAGEAYKRIEEFGPRNLYISETESAPA